MQGIARGFFPPETACYECTMGEVDWREIHRRRSCSMLARRADGRYVTWAGYRVGTGSGEASSRLAWDAALTARDLRTRPEA